MIGDGGDRQTKKILTRFSDSIDERKQKLSIDKKRFKDLSRSFRSTYRDDVFRSCVVASLEEIETRRTSDEKDFLLFRHRKKLHHTTRVVSRVGRKFLRSNLFRFSECFMDWLRRETSKDFGIAESCIAERDFSRASLHRHLLKFLKFTLKVVKDFTRSQMRSGELPSNSNFLLSRRKVTIDSGTFRHFLRARQHGTKIPMENQWQPTNVKRL